MHCEAPVGAPLVRTTRSLSTWRARRAAPMSVRSVAFSRRRPAPCAQHQYSQAVLAPQSPHRSSRLDAYGACSSALRRSGNPQSSAARCTFDGCGDLCLRNALEPGQLLFLKLDRHPCPWVD